MKTTLTQAIIIIFIALFTTISLHGQVTMGSNQPPVTGALLDLKQDGTTTKGLGLPRVKLTDLTDITKDISGVTAANADDHIGLIVYNISAITEECGTLPNGLYVWDGDQWQLIGNGSSGGAAYYFTDSRDNQRYLAGNFGTAGDWMLENLAYIPTESGFTNTAAASYTDKYYCYPKPYGAYTPGSPAPSTWSKQQGLLYNRQAATNGENPSTLDQAQVAGSVPGPNEVETLSGKIRGICPSGWHLPSDREWNDLEREMYNHPEKYSTYSSSNEFTPTTWNSAWEASFGGLRGSSPEGHGNVMKSSCELPDHSHTGDGDLGGKSLTSFNGGFSMLLVGFAIYGTNDMYGFNVWLWSSSSADSWSNHGRIMARGMGIVSVVGIGGEMLCPVRCKKD